MSYAIMQKELVVPEVGQLVRAFRALPSLTEIDAHTTANDAYGILMKGLEVEEASTLQDALLKEAVATEVIDESELPVIPPAKLVKQVEFLPAHLSMYDPMGRRFSLPWSDLMFIAAGNVRLRELRKTGSPHEEPRPDSVNPAKSKEEAQFHLMLEIVLAGGISRYSIKADDFVFNHLGARLTSQLPQNFALLVRELAQFAPHAGLNRGAFLICENSDQIFSYPSKSAFFEEITWLLWRIARA